MLRILRQVSVLVALAVLAVSALAAGINERSFPPNTKRGVLNGAAYPDVVIDGEIRQTLPNTRVYNEENLIVMPNQLTGNYIVINYFENDFGEVEKIWILTTAEIAKTLPKAEVWTPIPFKNPTLN